MRPHFILVGLLYLFGVSISQECTPELLENENFPGTDIQFLYSPDVEHCQLLCTQHPSCRFFTFVRSNSSDEKQHFHCNLKFTPSGEPYVRTSAQGFTSGFSLKPCNTDSKPCLSQVYYGVDFYGADYQTLFTANYEECQRACTHNPSCQFFTFISGNFTSAEYRYKCHLKFSWTVPRPCVKAGAGLVSGFSHSLQITQQSDTECQIKLIPNAKTPGNGTESLPAASPEHCHALCTAHPQCTYFSYASDDFMCHLKNNPNEMVLKAKEGVTSGMPTHSCQLDNNWANTTHEGVDFRGSDLRNVLTDDAEACQRTCTDDPNCQFYTYATEGFSQAANRRICYLKRVITVPAPPKVTKLANVVSGFSLKNCV
ncbi:coagulation factor XI-like [Enoplosus armatus]|uniref:coagulation factor XI-like n=1 Tax=Enoplosus armatus TaxID=215367 RepID=UPI00399521AB